MTRWVVLLPALMAACSAFGSDGGSGSTASAARHGRVRCNNAAATCDLATEVCCVNYESSEDQCIPSPGPVGLGTPCGKAVDAGDTRIVACDDTSECGSGEVCCADMTTASRLSAACVPAANCSRSGYTEMCNARGGNCANGRPCVPLEFYTAYSHCE